MVLCSLLLSLLFGGFAVTGPSGAVRLKPEAKKTDAAKGVGDYYENLVGARVSGVRSRFL